MLALLPVLAGCVVDTAESVGEVGEVGDEVVSVGSPFNGPNSAAATLPASNMFPQPTSSADADTGVNSIHEARFSDGLDLFSAATGDRVAWRDGAATGAFTAPPALGARLDEALAAADAKADAAMPPAAAEAGFLSMISVFGGGVSSTVDSKFYGFPTPRARWRRSFDGVVSPGPKLFEEARFRGARMYCAARELQRKQADRGKISMGQRSLATLTVFGHPIDLMTIEPTLVMDGPERFTNGAVADGAQSFTVPVLVGSKITPIGNIGIPGMPEVRAPLVFVTADGEVRNGAMPHPTTGKPRKFFQTVTHADAVVARQAHVEANIPDIPLFTIGIVDVELQLSAHADVGTSVAKNDRELGHDTTNPFFLAPRPRAADTSITGVKYNDSPFRIDSGSPLFPSPVDPGGAPGITIFQRVLAGEANLGLFQVTNPMLARGIQDDDHAIEAQHSVGMGAGLEAGVGLDIGILAISLNVGGGLEVNGGQVQELRDAMIRENQQPAAVLSAAPRGFVDAKYEAHIDLELRFGPFGFTVPIVHTGNTFARHDTTAWPETNRVRMGTGSATGSPMKQPAVLSHLPQDTGGAFASFPSGNDVDSCLLDTSENPETPPLCEADPGGGTRPVLNVCVTGRAVPGFPYPANVCADPVGYADTLRASGLSEEKATCIEDMLGFVCQPASGQVSSTRVSHITNIRPGTSVADLAAEAGEVASIMSSCEAPAAFGAGAATGLLFEVGVCDDKAQPFSPNSPPFAVVAGDTTIRPGTCN